MDEIKATTTLKLLKSKGACSDGYATLIKYLGSDYSEDDQINLLTILESNGVSHCLWALRATIDDCSKVSRLIASDCAESVLYIYQNKYPNDDRPKNSIQVARNFANGLVSAAAAYDSACAAFAAAYFANANANAANADVSDDTYSAAYAAYAAYAAATHSNDDASYASYAYNASAYANVASAYPYVASAKEKNNQSEIIKKYLTF